MAKENTKAMKIQESGKLLQPKEAKTVLKIGPRTGNGPIP